MVLSWSYLFVRLWTFQLGHALDSFLLPGGQNDNNPEEEKQPKKLLAALSSSVHPTNQLYWASSSSTSNPLHSNPIFLHHLPLPSFLRPFLPILPLTLNLLFFPLLLHQFPSLLPSLTLFLSSFLLFSYYIYHPQTFSSPYSHSCFPPSFLPPPIPSFLHSFLPSFLPFSYYIYHPKTVSPPPTAVPLASLLHFF